jgi:uncharacterized damage-inducible protein DinB
MKEIDRIKKLVHDHYNGQPWLDVTIMGVLEDLTYLEASKKIGEHNTIWQLVVHITEWKNTCVARIMGKKSRCPEHNYILPVEDNSELAWVKALSALEEAHFRLMDILTTYKKEDLNEVYKNKHTYYEHLSGIIIHDAYHLGQIMLLKKLIREKISQKPSKVIPKEKP